MNLLDIFNDDAFSLTALTAAINNMDHVPGRAGAVVFEKLDSKTKGIATTAVSIESQHETLTLIQTSARGAPAPQELQDKRSLRGFTIPQIKLEDTIGADQIQSVRAFGGVEELDPMTAVRNQMDKMNRRHDLTHEYHRLGALTGIIYDADGSVLVNLFDAFDVLNSDGQPAPETFSFDLDNYTLPAFDQEVRVKCMRVTRFMSRKAKTPTSKAKAWAFCGDEFFNKLVSHPTVKKVWDGTESAKRQLGDNFAFDVFEMGGIFFENYRGTDDETTVAIADHEARFFLTGEVPGLYGEYFAPADFMDTVNTPGLKRYARIALDPRFQQHVELHTQSNPLPLCLRPQTLVRGVVSDDSE